MKGVQIPLVRQYLGSADVKESPHPAPSSAISPDIISERTQMIQNTLPELEQLEQILMSVGKREYLLPKDLKSARVESARTESECVKAQKVTELMSSIPPADASDPSDAAFTNLFKFLLEDFQRICNEILAIKPQEVTRVIDGKKYLEVDFTNGTEKSNVLPDSCIKKMDGKTYVVYDEAKDPYNTYAVYDWLDSGHENLVVVDLSPTDQVKRKDLSAQLSLIGVSAATYAGKITKGFQRQLDDLTR